MSRRLWLLLCEFLIIRKIVSFATYLICLAGLDKAFNKTSILWQRVPNFWRHVAKNMAVGLGIALLLVSMHGTPWLTDIEDAGIDWVMRINRGTHTQVNAKPFAFLEIDETTYRYWGEPFHAPREDIKTLIEFARTGNPAIIFVDIELANPGSSPESDCQSALKIDPSSASNFDPPQRVNLGRCFLS